MEDVPNPHGDERAEEANERLVKVRAGCYSKRLDFVADDPAGNSGVGGG
jgi:hypothetical protein